MKKKELGCTFYYNHSLSREENSNDLHGLFTNLQFEWIVGTSSCVAAYLENSAMSSITNCVCVCGEKIAIWRIRH